MNAPKQNSIHHFIYAVYLIKNITELLVKQCSKCFVNAAKQIEPSQTVGINQSQITTNIRVGESPCTLTTYQKSTWQSHA